MQILEAMARFMLYACFFTLLCYGLNTARVGRFFLVLVYNWFRPKLIRYTWFWHLFALINFEKQATYILAKKRVDEWILRIARDTCAWGTYHEKSGVMELEGFSAKRCRPRVCNVCQDCHNLKQPEFRSTATTRQGRRKHVLRREQGVFHFAYGGERCLVCSR